MSLLQPIKLRQIQIPCTAVRTFKVSCLNNMQKMPRIGGLPPSGANKPPMRNIMAGKILPSIDPNEFNK